MKKDKVVTFKVSKEEKKDLEQLAKNLDLSSVSKLVRQALDKLKSNSEPMSRSKIEELIEIKKKLLHYSSSKLFSEAELQELNSLFEKKKSIEFDLTKKEIISIGRKNTEYFMILKDEIDTWAQTKEGIANTYREIILKAPNLFILLNTLVNEKVISDRYKASLGKAISYFILPNDLIPEDELGADGYRDDVVLANRVIYEIYKSYGEEIITKNWDDESDPIELIKKIEKSSVEIVGPEIHSKLLDLL
jgi:uncharacterized membrane protein YkvA (DUF1232 family)